MKHVDKRKQILEEAIVHLKPEAQEVQRKRFEQTEKLEELASSRVRSKFLNLEEAREHQAALKKMNLPINGWPLSDSE